MVIHIIIKKEVVINDTTTTTNYYYDNRKLIKEVKGNNIIFLGNENKCELKAHTFCLVP